MNGQSMPRVLIACQRVGRTEVRHRVVADHHVPLGVVDRGIERRRVLHLMRFDPIARALELAHDQQHVVFRVLDEEHAKRAGCAGRRSRHHVRRPRAGLAGRGLDYRCDRVEVLVAAQIEVAIDHRRRRIEAVVQRVLRDHLERRPVLQHDRRAVAAREYRRVLRRRWATQTRSAPSPAAAPDSAACPCSRSNADNRPLFVFRM